ncbi:unnamed protein product [Candida verbasci]|uniref:ferric-chelate reductase (NADPH) n=1 Tax=Candida verbasci TaxID=1227364 RepID=A0A9W4TW70_9ASCO|nr:unnamed protein product [Candida verbasci]
MFITRYLVLFSFISYSQAVIGAFQIYHNYDFPVQACSGLIGKTAVYFNSTLEPNGYCNFHNQPALGTMAECIEMIPLQNSRKLFLKSCKKLNLTEDQYLKALQNATEFGFVNVTSDKDYKKGKNYYKPALLTKKKVHAAYDSVATRWYNYNQAQFFGLASMCYWWVVLGIASIWNLTYFIAPKFILSLKGKFSNYFRKYITLPALFSKTHAHHKHIIFHKFIVVFPTRLEAILVFLWFSMTLIMCCTNYVHVVPNSIWPQRNNELGRKVADRTGQMVLWLLPPLVLFSGRNNFVQWISGWSFARFIYIHKWISRVAFMMMIAHGVGMTYNGRGIGKYYTRNKQPYVRWGMTALTSIGLMCFQSLIYFRRSNYEVFLAIHILLAVFAIIGLWIHTRQQGYHMWMIAAVSVWVFDRVVRIARLFAFGVKTADVQLIANETIKVIVNRPKYWKPFPGCHAFIHFFRPTCFWQSHPFTIVDSINETNTITFYLKVKGGMTHGLYQFLSKQPNQKAKIKVSVEGPYGNPLPLSNFDYNLLIAGGNGIPGIYYETIDLIKNKKSSYNKVKLYWVIRHYRSLEWFYQELNKLKQFDPSLIDVTIFITQPHVGLTQPIITDATDDEEDEEESQEKHLKDDGGDAKVEVENFDYIEKLKQSLNHINFQEYKPNFYELVAQEIKQNDFGSMAISTCAHGSQCDDVRKAIGDNLNESNYRVELFEQIQSW